MIKKGLSCQARRGRRGVSLGTARASPLDRLRSSSFAPPQGGSGCGGAFGALGTRIGEHQGSCAGAAPLAPKRGGATGASRPLVQGAFGPGIVVYLIGPLGPPLERRTEISSQSTPLLGSRAFAAPELLFSTHLLSLSLCVPTALTEYMQIDYATTGIKGHILAFTLLLNKEVINSYYIVSKSQEL